MWHRVIWSKFHAEDAVCVCVWMCKLSVWVYTSNYFQRIPLIFNKTCYGHGAIQGYQHLVTPVITPCEFEQFERYCSYKKYSYYASTCILAGPALARAVRHRLLPAEDWFRNQTSPYGIYGGLSGPGRRFSSGISLFLLSVSFHRCSVAHSSVIVPIRLMFVIEISVQ
jgi:hypothetical protein